MPTSYQTSATSRGGRRREDSERHTSSKASHEGLQKLSKKVSKSSDRNEPSMSDRAASPASFLSSRSMPTERNTLPHHPGLHTPSTISLSSQRSLPHLDDETPMTVPPTTNSPEVRPIRQPPATIEGSVDGSNPAVSQIPRPGAASETVKPILPSPVSDVPSRERPSAQPIPGEGPGVLRPTIEESSDGEMLTPTPARPLSQERPSSADFDPQHVPKEVIEEKESKHGLAKKATSQSPPPAMPAMSPSNSPRVHYQTAAPMDYGPNMSPTLPHYSYAYPPNMAVMPGAGPFYANRYYNAPYSPPIEQRQPYDVSGGGQPARSGTEDLREVLLQKVERVLPDIHRLLDEYKSEKEYEEKLSRLKIELDANKKEYEKVIQSLVADRGKVEREATVLRQQVADLHILAEEHGQMQIQVVSLQNSHKELKASLETSQRVREELLSTKEAQEKGFQTRGDAHSRYITEIQKQHEESLSAKEKEHQQALSEQKNMLSKTQLDLAGLISKHANLKNDLEISRSLQNDHKMQVDAKMKELDDTRARHAEEIQIVQKTHQEDRGRSLNENEAQNARVAEDHDRREQKWMQDLETLRNEIQTHKKDFEKERKEHENLRATRRREQDQASELARGIASWTSKHAELQTEHENVGRLLQSLSPVAETKSKGDDFFIEAFQQLATSVAALSIERFYNPPTAVPKDILRLIPSGIPDFTEQTDAARQLRAFYVQHKIFEVLTRRIFQPFLLTLDCHVDVFLQGLSIGIRSKSERREAAWRQITLRAAYTGAQAKRATNLVRHKIAEEILGEIKWFTDEAEWSSLAFSVHFVVKAAVELGRYAKLERELVTASMPGASMSKEDQWHEINRRSSRAGGQSEGIVVLGIIPYVARDAVHKAHLHSHERFETGSFTFLHGLALYNDSEVIVTRRQEIMDAQELWQHIVHAV